MLKNIHRRHQIKGVGGEARAFEVDEAAGQPALAEAPLAEIQHRRADVGQRHLQPVPGEQNSTGTNPGAEVKIAPAAMPSGEQECDHIGER